MDYKEILAKYGVEEKEGLLNDLNSFLDASLAKNNDNNIPYDRFKRVVDQKNDALDKLANSESKVETLSKQSNTEELATLKEENARLKETNTVFETEKFNTGLEQAKSVYNKIMEKDGDKFVMDEAVRNSFGVLPEKIEDFTQESLSNFQAILKPLEALGVFKDNKDGKPKGTPPDGGNPNNPNNQSKKETQIDRLLAIQNSIPTN